MIKIIGNVIVCIFGIYFIIIVKLISLVFLKKMSFVVSYFVYEICIDSLGGLLYFGIVFKIN